MTFYIKAVSEKQAMIKLRFFCQVGKPVSKNPVLRLYEIYVFNSLETLISLSRTSPDTILVHFKTKQSINGETEIFSNGLTHDFGQKM